MRWSALQEGARAHPRSRGENTVAALALHGNAGSSPLTRGKQMCKDNPVTLSRLIPAHAGKTVFMIVVVATLTAHPRSRGENPEKPSDTDNRPGSSPLTRGKRVARLDIVRRRGLIPAHAGKTISETGLKALDRAHPRSRGENGPHRRPRTRKRGSSPLTRGKLAAPALTHAKTRLIPAHAGKTGYPDAAQGVR